MNRAEANKKNHKRTFCMFLSATIVVILITLISSVPFHNAFAVEGVVETSLMGNLKDDGQGCGVFSILNLVVDILSIGVGILGIIGITIVGIQYLTAGGNVEQTKKAKHRMFQIVIGLIVYVLLYAGIQWLLPGGKLNTTSCTTISDQELAAIKAEEEKAKEEAKKQLMKKGGSSKSSSNSESPASSQDNASVRQRIADYAVKYAWPYKEWHKNKSKLNQAPPGYYEAFKSVLYKWEKALQKNKGWRNSARLKGKSCSSFAATMVRLASTKENQNYPKGFPTPSQNVYKYLKKSKCWKKVSGKLEPGDIDIQTKNGEGKHTAVIVYSNGKPTSVEASNGSSYGRVNKAGNRPSRGRKHNYYRYVCDA